MSKRKVASNKAPATIDIEVEPAHFNAKTDPARIDAVADYYLTGKQPEDLNQVVRDRAVAKLKTIECPAECPTDHEEWRAEVARLLGIAVYKMAARLAKEGDSIALSQLPVAMAISLDKRLLLSGSPTSYNFSVNATINHESLMKRIKENKPPP